MEFKGRKLARIPPFKRKAKVAPKVVTVRIARSIPSIARRVNPFNDKLKCKMTYYTQNFITTGAVNAGSWVFSANGCYDPDITFGGHQTLAFDQLMLMYDHYTVLSSKMTVNWDNPSGLAIAGAIQLSDSPTPLTAQGQIVENGLVTTEFITSSVQAKCQMVSTVNIGKFMGRPGILTEDDFRGSSAANPVEQVYFTIYAWNLNSVAANSLPVDVLIEYDVVLTEPKRLPQS